jgi:hypothetical protein
MHVIDLISLLSSGDAKVTQSCESSPSLQGRFRNDWVIVQAIIAAWMLRVAYASNLGGIAP